MEEYHSNAHRADKNRIAERYVPRFAQILIDLYTSSLKYEVLEEMGYDKKFK